MGVDYKAVIFYGLPFDELDVESDKLEEQIDDGEIEVCPCYFDAGREGCLFGYFMATGPDYGAVELSTVMDYAKEARDFEKLFGKQGRLFLSTCGW